MSDGSNIGCFSHRWPLLGARKSVPKKLKNNSFSKIYPLKAHAHNFTVLIYLATRRAAKLGIFTHFMFTNLPQCSQSINSLLYVCSMQITAAFYECLITIVIALLRPTAAPPKILSYPQRLVPSQPGCTNQILKEKK